MKDRKPKIYIAGKISGEPIHSVTLKFGRAQSKFEAKDYEVLNPLAIVNDWHTTWDNAMRKCIAAMMTADEIYMLRDWNRSRGAQIERDIALQLKMKISYE
ncbi:DUF4406 domain-containing protein [Chryseobacterium sp. TY4]